MYYIPRKGEEWTQLCDICHKPFTFVGNGVDAPACCPDCADRGGFGAILMGADWTQEPVQSLDELEADLEKWLRSL